MPEKSVSLFSFSLAAQFEYNTYMRPVINFEKCIGCGNCQEVCPAVFHLNQDLGKAEVMDPEGCEFAGCCEAAAENCPVEAITLEEGE